MDTRRIWTEDGGQVIQSAELDENRFYGCKYILDSLPISITALKWIENMVDDTTGPDGMRSEIR